MAQTPEERRAKQAAWYAANREKRLAQAAAWQKANPERRAAHRTSSRETDRARSKAWLRANPDKGRAIQAAYRARNRASESARGIAWAAANPVKCCANASRRRVAQLQATPLWLGPDHHAEILGWYQQATNTGLHVDHIVPLQGKTVCGLHVPWNMQLLSQSENSSKGNRYSE